jgi:UrcA family protein
LIPTGGARRKESRVAGELRAPDAVTTRMDGRWRKHVNRAFNTSATAAIFAAFVWTGAAHASSTRVGEANAPSEVVQFRAADLSTMGGANALYDRIDTAAWHVCRDMFEANTTPEALQRLQCTDTLIDAAVEDVHSTQLTAVRDQKKGGAYVPRS